MRGDLLQTPVANALQHICRHAGMRQRADNVFQRNDFEQLATTSRDGDHVRGAASNSNQILVFSSWALEDQAGPRPSVVRPITLHSLFEIVS